MKEKSETLFSCCLFWPPEAEKHRRIDEIPRTYYCFSDALRTSAPTLSITVQEYFSNPPVSLLWSGPVFTLDFRFDGVI